jgi:hypothetical protein
MLKVLHLSDSGLPNWRLEKSAISGLKFGYQVFFCGGKIKNTTENIFSKTYYKSWNYNALRGIPYYYELAQKNVLKILKEINPDLIHVHNVALAKMVSKQDIPFVFDNYEYWTMYAKVLSEMTPDLTNLNKIHATILKYGRIFIRKHTLHKWSHWEKDVVSTHPTITVSNAIADELKYVGNTHNVFVVPNFPLKSESIATGEIFHHEILSSAYAGSDKIGGRNPPFRNLDNLTSIFENNDLGNITFIGIEGVSSEKIKYTGFISRTEMFEEMRKHSVGLIPWKKHWSHYYLNPNKYAEYAHAGLFVMCTSSLKTIIDTLGDNCSTFKDYEDMVEKLTFFKNNMEDLYSKRLKTYEYAKENLIWDKYEENIIRAYKIA